MPKVERMFCYIVEGDGGPDDEGVPAVVYRGIWHPLMGADLARAKSLESSAQEVADGTGKPVRLLVFDGPPRVINVLHPQPTRSPGSLS